MISLMTDEKLIMETEISWKRLIPAIVFIAFLAILCAMASFIGGGGKSVIVMWLCVLFMILLCMLDQMFREKSFVFIITDRRIYGKNGIVHINTMDTPLNKINNIVVEQNFFGNIFGYGNIRVVTSSGTHIIKDIKNPERVKVVVLQEIEQFREKNMKKQAEEIAVAMKNIQ